VDLSLDKPGEECGIFGVYNHPEASNLAYLGLYALQHRGQEAAGIVSSDRGTMHLHKRQGLVGDIFGRDVLSGLPGSIALGHVRYSTTGGSHLRNAQPFAGERPNGGWVAVGHNGNLVNTPELSTELASRGVVPTSSSDSECIMHLIRLSKAAEFGEQVREGLTPLKGSFSLLIMNEDSMVAARDPNGFRPLCLGRLKGDGYAVASESCAFDLIEADYIRDVEPGEMIILKKKGMRSVRYAPQARLSQCIFEFIYFARPDSLIFGAPVHVVRKELGRQLAWESPAPGDIVVPVPDSAVVAALGYAEASRIPYELGLIRNHYVGRTFIEPTQQIRDFGTRVKLNPVKAAIAGKRIVLVDDSIVRGTTLKKITKILRQAGAKEIHVRISSPPHQSPCFYGIDFPTKKELVAFGHTRDEVRRFLGVESLEYISIEGLLKAVRNVNGGFCLACFDGRYPVAFEAEPVKDSLETAKPV
jgi:amidophosphoribosyltransferase